MVDLSPVIVEGPAVAPVPPDSPPVHILIVDDDRAKRAALKAALRPLNVTIIEADSGVAALRCLMKQNFAAILLDVFMPIMDGFETAALIRQRRESELTPIIFITASNVDEIADLDRFAEGAVDFIFAPADPGELRAKVSVFANLFVTADLLAAQALAVQISADHLRMVTDVAPIGIFQTDAQRRYVYTNPRWSEITGISHAEAVGHPLESIIASELRPNLVRRLDDPDNQEAELTYRFEIPDHRSGHRTALITVAPIPDVAGGVAGLIGTVADVTAEADAEAAMSEAHAAATSASQLKSDFLANMSHEIRTPMNGVIGMADLLLETNLDPRQHEYAQTVRNSGEALLIIINDILDFSKVESGMVEVEDTEMRIHAIVDDVADLLATTALAKGIELVTIIDSSLPQVVRGDPGRLRQVLMNFIGNAIKFTEAGEVVVRVTRDSTKDSVFAVRFEVTDSGEGIAPEKLGAIFQPFVQVDTSTSRRHGGTGLGLAISGQLVTLMGGEYGVSSQISDGSTFWFTVRVGDVRSSGDPEDASQVTSLAGLKVLVVEDNATQRSALTDQLTHWGMKVTAEDSGPPALLVLQNAAALGEPFAVGLIDKSMEQMSGLEFGQHVTGDLGLTTPLVLMVGVGQDEVLDADSAFHALLAKPVRLDSLLSSLTIALDRTAAAPGLLQSHQPPSASRPPTRRVLLAEDNLINRKVALAMLEGSRYAVDTVSDGEQAVEAFRLAHYDAILMDCQMPGMNGFEATTAIRSQETEGHHTPIIALTAGARAEDRERCLIEGMDGYLSKPVSKVQLLELLASFTGHRDPPEEIPSLPAAGDGSRQGDSRPASVRPALDEDIVAQLDHLGTMAGEDLVGRLGTLFLEDADIHISIMSGAIADSDVESLSQSAHALSGSSANLGATELARLCATYASATGGELPTDTAWFVPAVMYELERVRAALADRSTDR